MTDLPPPPFEAYLAQLHRDLQDLAPGTVAQYIPELAKAPPEALGLAIATLDGRVYHAGDTDTPFTIQSVSKPFMYGAMLAAHGQERLLEHVGVEPTGDPFNSITLDTERNRPFNPMVNAGAIAVAELVPGDTQAARLAETTRIHEAFAGRALAVDRAVYASEHATGHRNRAIAYLMLNSGMIQCPPDQVLEIYFSQCSLAINCEDLAIMGATLANQGVNPRTGAQVIGPAEVRDTLAVMLSCGMYDQAGQWIFEVGLPAKSGVSGGVLAVLPGQLAIAVWSPGLGPGGNSVRGIEACRRISRDFGLHMVNATNAADSAIRAVRQEGGEAVLILQGALRAASADRVIQRARALAEDKAVARIALDFHRIHLADEAALRLLDLFLETASRLGPQIRLQNVAGERQAEGLRAHLHTLAARHGVECSDGEPTG